jgi:hypothetical protein
VSTRKETTRQLRHGESLPKDQKEGTFHGRGGGTSKERERKQSHNNDNGRTSLRRRKKKYTITRRKRPCNDEKKGTLRGRGAEDLGMKGERSFSTALASLRA